MIRKLLEVKDAALREAVVQELNNSPTRQLSFSLWATRIMQSRRAGNSIHTLGFYTHKHLCAPPRDDTERWHFILCVKKYFERAMAFLKGF